MILIDVETELNLFKGKTVPCQCENCEEIFYVNVGAVRREIKMGGDRFHYCSNKCWNIPRRNRIEAQCRNCNNKFIRKESAITRSENNFCSRSCSGAYGNTHRTHGYRTSKLEIWLQRKLVEIYPELEFHFNKKEAVHSELDIYIPSLGLAFELNGVFHYEPIFGEQKLEKIINNDNRKFQACLERGIELCIIDTSKQKYFKENNSDEYLGIIRSIIDGKLTA